ncbi:serine protease [Iamia majanohamensis]|uniref:Serine protease n=1 Tax=Iamia majanohamensis TaxID=467976 RepID=A0AAF0BSN8_9ACTN|nr:serine protease [Iamia majanohamensis]WCO65542.1 serine protease [Iamia majanohamensis]
MTTRRWAAAVALLVALGLAGCSDDSGDGGAYIAPSSGADLDGSQVLARVGPGVALVQTPLGSGSAVLLEDGHLVTNAHVVDPFPSVEVSFGDDDPTEVPVVGVDLAADVAVLGPVETDADGLALRDAAAVAPGADLYLVGHPGDVDQPEVTIARGVLSRRREAPTWGLSFLQTDAAIGEGQSGGAVVDGQGEVVGISGSSLDDQFALALEGDDAADAVEAILDGDGSEQLELPAADDVEEGPFEVEQDVGSGTSVLYVPADEVDGELTVEVDGAEGVAVDVMTLDGYREAWNEVAADDADPEATDPDEDGTEPTPEAAPGRWDLEVDGDVPLVVYVDARSTAVDAVDVELSVPAAPLPLPEDASEDLAVGDAAEGTVSMLGEANTYLVDLEEGDEVEVTVSSAVGDMAFAVVPPGDREAPGEEVDDGGGGLFDLDASEVLTADEDGTYAVQVYAVDGYSTDYRIAVTEAG